MADRLTRSTVSKRLSDGATTNHALGTQSRLSVWHVDSAGTIQSQHNHRNRRIRRNPSHRAHGFWAPLCHSSYLDTKGAAPSQITSTTTALITRITNDGGASTTDGITNTGTFSLSGVGKAGSTIYLWSYVSGTWKSVASVKVAANGIWTYGVKNLKDGSYIYEATTKSSAPRLLPSPTTQPRPLHRPPLFSALLPTAASKATAPRMSRQSR